MLVATRAVSEQLRQSLVQKGEKEGMPILTIASEEGGLATLAALCAFAPAVVAKLVSPDAAAQAQRLEEVAAPTVEALRRDMAAWSLGKG